MLNARKIIDNSSNLLLVYEIPEPIQDGRSTIFPITIPKMSANMTLFSEEGVYSPIISASAPIAADNDIPLYSFRIVLTITLRSYRSTQGSHLADCKR